MTTTTTITAAPSVTWNRRFDVFLFRGRGYWVRAVDLAGDQIADTMMHLRAQSWWSSTYEADLRRAVRQRRRELSRPAKPKLHASTARRLVASYLAGYRRWKLANDHGLTVDEITAVLRDHGIVARDRKRQPAGAGR